MKNYWETPGNNGGTFYVVLSANTVGIGQHYGSGHTDNGTTVSFKKFLAGSYQDLVRKEFSKAEFEEIMTAIKG